MAGSVRYSEVYGRSGQAASPLPPAVNEASGPPEADTRPAIMFLAMFAMLFFARIVWERAE